MLDSIYDVRLLSTVKNKSDAKHQNQSKNGNATLKEKKLFSTVAYEKKM